MAIPRGTIEERPALALAGLLRGDVDAIQRALVAPRTLAPTQIRTLAEQWGVADGIFGAAIRTVTDPIFMIGLLLSVRFPIPLARNMFKYKKMISGYNAKVNPVLSMIRSPLDTYAGTASKKALLGVGLERKVFAERHVVGLAEGMTKLEKALGHNMTYADDVLAHGMTDVLPVRAPIRIKRKQIAKAMGIPEGEVPDWIVSGKAWLKSPAGRPELDEYAEVVRKFHEGTLDDLAVVTAQDLRTRRVTQVRWKGLPNAKPVEISERYYPHAVASRYSDINEDVARTIQETIKQIDAEKGGQFIPDSVRQSVKNAVSARPSPHTLIRQQRMIPDPTELKLIREHLVDPNMPEFLEAFLRTEKGSQFRTYSLRGTRVLQDYTNQMGKLYAWHAKGHGKMLMADLARFKTKGPFQDKMKAHILENHYIPAIMDQKTGYGAAIDEWWAGKLARGYKALGKDSVLRKAVGNKWSDQMQNWMLAERGPLQLGNLGYAAQAYLYGSTISGNVAMATLNLGQTFLTLATFINPRHLGTGFSRVMKGIGSYATHRKAGLIHERALQRAWPEFGKAGLSFAPITEEAIGGALQRAWTVSGTPESVTLFGRGLDRVRRFSMAMFTASETFNRVWGFESAFVKYMAEAKVAGFRGARVVEQARNFARETVQQAHFLAGPELSPAILARVPGVFKQFMQFPARSFEFLGAAGKFGSEAQSGLLGRNWGTLGRMGMMYSAARHISDVPRVDLQRGIGIHSMMPVSPEFSPGGPIPLPPLLSLALAGVRDLQEGELKYLPYSAQLLLPGGVAAMRVGTVVAPLLAPNAGPEIMAAVHRKYVDYRTPTPDGKYPMYSRTGGLMGYFGPWDLIQQATGIGRGGQAARTERDLMGYLVTQRKRSFRMLCWRGLRGCWGSTRGCWRAGRPGPEPSPFGPSSHSTKN